MSQTAGVACLTCRRHGPLVGDYGYVGLPASESLESCEVSGGSDEPSFGYLYEGLKAVGLRRFDLDSLAEWLQEHAGHRFAINLGDSNPEVDEMEEEDGVGEAAEELWDSLEARLEDELANGTYVQARHKATCLECNVHVLSPDLDPFHAYPPYRIDEEAAAMFVERWGHPDAESWCYHPGTAVDPLEEYMPALIGLIREHASHGVQIELTTG